jgi:predicted nucleotidyltransferase component of viral defense system
LRYSEDIDLAQVRAERIGATIDAARDALAWLGDCARDRAGHSTHLVFRFTPETAPDTELNLKVEINTREHTNVLGLKTYPFELANGWYQARADVVSFEPEELFGTKLRALLQRRQGRDLFDLHEGLEQLGLNPGKVIACFEHYLERHPISRAEAEQRMLEKLTRSLTEDVDPLLPAGVHFSEDDAIEAFGRVWNELVVRIKGDAWKLTDKAIGELREKKYPKLLK